jgi:hypothetical protein
MSKLAEKYGIDFTEYLYYDEESKSCLRWAKDIFSGLYDNLQVANKNSDAGTLSKYNRYVVTINGVKYQASLIVAKLRKIENSDNIGGCVVDHRDKNSLNNKESNLRVVNQATNLRNSGKRKTNKSGKVGVSWITRYGTCYAVAQWNDYATGKTKGKWFSEKKLGKSEAFEQACRYRDYVINKMNEDGAGYTEDHL